jgi:hypothetical protein
MHSRSIQAERQLEESVKRSLAMAVVAAVGGCTIGAVQMVRGGSDGSPSMLVPIAPCRLFDTRPAPDNVGPRDDPGGARPERQLRDPDDRNGRRNERHRGGRHGRELPHDLAVRRAAPACLESELGARRATDAEQGRRPPVSRRAFQPVQPQRHGRRTRRRRRLLHSRELGLAGRCRYARPRRARRSHRSHRSHRSCGSDGGKGSKGRHGRSRR